MPNVAKTESPRVPPNKGAQPIFPFLSTLGGLSIHNGVNQSPKNTPELPSPPLKYLSVPRGDNEGRPKPKFFFA